jgi:hypothetical protein
MRITRSLFVALLCVVAALGVYAQSGNLTTGGVGGQVTDAGGAGLPGVTVTVTNLDTGLTRNAVTENDGTYAVNLLPPGNYKIVAELAGLGSATVPKSVVLLGNTTKTNIKLTPTVTESITITAAAPVVDTTRSGTATSVTEQQIENLPILARDFKSLASLTPGVVTAFGGRVTSNGVRGLSTDYNIDGASSNNDFFGENTGGTRAPFTFSQAAIKEFQVVRSQYNAEFGRGVGSQLNAITKSGSNNTDGELFYYKRNAKWASTRPSVLSNGQTVTESFRARDSTQPGFAVGGPIVRDHLFYFANFDGQNQKLPISPTDITLNPAFIALTPALQQQFFDKIQALIGHPYANELVYNQTFNQKTYFGKLDANVGMKNHFSFRDNFSRFTNANNQSFNLLSNQGVEQDKFNQAVAQGETVFTPNIFNQFIAQFSTDERPIAANSSTPEVVVTYAPGRTAFFGQNDFLPNNTKEKKTQLKDSVQYIMGEHSFKVGGEGLLMHIDNLFPRNLNGIFRYNSVSDFVNNIPASYNQGYGPGGGLTSWTQNTYAFYASDNFRFGNKWSFDLGARYDWQTMPKPATNAFPQHPEFISQIKEDHNIAPRFGFAYDVRGNGRSVLRGGTGKFFGYMPDILLSNPLTQISGNFNQITINNCAATTNIVKCPTYPGLLTPDQFNLLAKTSTDIVTVGSNYQAQEAWRSSLQYEQQLGTTYSAGVGVIYQHTTHIEGSRNINAVLQPYTFGNVPVYNVASPNRLYTDMGVVRELFSGEQAWYRAYTLETHKLAISNSKLTWDFSYTWSKAIDQDTNERSTSTSFLYDPFNPKLSQGPSDNDVRHRLVGDVTYRLPLGFLISGIWTWRSGLPYTQAIAFSGTSMNINGLTQTTGNLPVFVDSTNTVIDLTRATGFTRPQFADFLNSQGAHIIGRNKLRQPEQWDADLRVAKMFNISHGAQLEILGEVFNIFNTRNKFVISSNQNQFNMAYNAATDKYTITKVTNFGLHGGYDNCGGSVGVCSSDPRQFQVAAKIIF